MPSFRIDDWARAQELADTLSPDRLHRTLDRYAAKCCPVSDVFGQSYHWSLMQVDQALLHALQNPRVNIAGARRRDLRPDLGTLSPTRLSRQLRRLLDLGVIKRATGPYRYYLTKAGRAATAAAETAHRGDCHSGYDLMGFGGRYDSTQEAGRVGR